MSALFLIMSQIEYPRTFNSIKGSRASRSSQLYYEIDPFLSPSQKPFSSSESDAFFQSPKVFREKRNDDDDYEKNVSRFILDLAWCWKITEDTFIDRFFD